MSVVAAAVIGTAVVGTVAANKQAKAAQGAAQTQAASAEAGIDEQRRQFDAIQELLKPYVNAGTVALAGQQDLLGVNGRPAQQNAINAIQESPQFTSMQRLGETSILANASATGGLRGGNTQSALAQFSPQLLSQLIEQQYGRLGGMTQLGQNSAVQQANVQQQSGTAISNLLQQRGAALAGGEIAQGRAYAGYANALTGGLGMYVGLGGKF